MLLLIKYTRAAQLRSLLLLPLLCNTHFMAHSSSRSPRVGPTAIPPHLLPAAPTAAATRLQCQPWQPSAAAAVTCTRTSTPDCRASPTPRSSMCSIWNRSRNSSSCSWARTVASLWGCIILVMVYVRRPCTCRRGRTSTYQLNCPDATLRIPRGCNSRA